MSATPTTSRGRSRGRGGLGKYLRARGRRGGGRPAEFVTRLRLEGEEEEEAEEEDGEEDGGVIASKYSRRQIDTNAYRYEEPEIDPHGELLFRHIRSRGSNLFRQRKWSQNLKSTSHLSSLDSDSQILRTVFWQPNNQRTMEMSTILCLVSSLARQPRSSHEKTMFKQSTGTHLSMS